MLSNTEIQNHLEQLGFTQVPPKNPEKYKVLQFKHRNFDNSIYVKKANRLPLVIHGKYKALYTELVKISGVNHDASKPLYFNSNMKDFDKQKNTGQNPEHFGLHFGFDTTAALETFLNKFSHESIMRAKDSISLDESSTAQSPTEKEALIKVRIGQGAYRKALLDYWGGCAVTGCAVEALLVSSHIKPWSVDKDARLDPFNGLLLSPTLDRAFDQRLISFNDDGSIILSPVLTETDMKLLHLDSTLRLRKVDPRHLPYLAWHRANLVKE
ncbi:HNH endonuclease [Acinetobacter baumannii]